MFNCKKLVSGVLAVAMLGAISTSVFASEDRESMYEIFRTSVNSRGEAPISTFEGTSGDRISARTVVDGITFIHESGFDRRPMGSTGDALERVWGETSHVKDGVGVNGYTRARYELGTNYQGDSERQWDSDDGKISGYSKATSKWVTTTFNFHTGHTYYGH